MSNKEQLEKKIAELKKGLASGEKVGLPANVKQNLEKLLSESEKELAELEKEPKKDEPKKEATKEPKIKSKVAAIKKSIKKEPQEKKEKPKSALERCKDLLSRYKKQKKTSSVRAEKRRKAGKPATLTPAEAVSKTAKSVKVKVVSIKEKTDAGLSKGEINKMVSGIVSTIKATLDGIVTSADKNEFLREIQAEIRDLRTDMPKVAEMGGSVDFNEGAGMFAKGGFVVTGWTKDSGAGMFANGGKLTDEQILSKTIVYDNNGETFDRYTVFTPDGSVYGMSENATGFNQYLGEKDEVRKGSHLGKKLKSVPESIKSAVLGRMRYEQGGATDFVNNGAGMFANGGGLKSAYKIIQDTEGVYEQGFYLVVDTSSDELIDIFEFKSEAQDYLKAIKEKGVENVDASNFNGQKNKYAKGGIFSSREYKRGLAYKLDRAKYNKSEKWEKPLTQRKSK